MKPNALRRVALLLSACAGWLLNSSATAIVLAGDVLPPVSERFAPEKETSLDESPDFRQHVLPLMGRLGCNGRACHGSFQGQGGFRLSLFGYDAQMDHDALMKGAHPRVDAKDVDKSLLLLKPSKQVEHEGGERLKKDSWQFRLVKKWITDGAKPVPADGPKFDHLEITPKEIVFAKKGETAQLKVIAVWHNGIREDVTPICRFRSNDDGVARINEDGLITSLEVGDTDVVAFYDNGVQPIPVMLPVSDKVGPNFPDIAAPTKVDQLITEKLRKAGIVPSEVCADVEFLRRACLDITGTLPIPSEIDPFVNDKSPDKRAKKIDELLERPGYAAWWATKFCDWTGNNATQFNQFFQNSGIDNSSISAQWYYWIFERLKTNVPYDKMIEGIVVSRSREPGEEYEAYCKELQQTSQGDPKEFAKHSTMPYYWMRQNFRKPEDMVIGFSYTFLGLQIQCAQCHKHPFDQWSKKDFDKFAGFFTRIGVGVAPDAAEQFSKLTKETNLTAIKDNKELRQKVMDFIKAGQAIPQRELFVGLKPGEKPNTKALAEKGIKGIQPPPVGAATASLLGGESLDLSKLDDPRQALMDWMRNDPTKYFARSIVNRVWASYFSQGIVNPADELNLANPPSNAALLDFLTKAFVEHNYDLKWLHREVTNSLAYQRSWKVNETNRLDLRNFSHASPRRLPAEVAYDALVQATAGDDEIKAMQEKIDDRAIGPYVGVAGKGKRNGNTYVMTVFGRPPRISTCDCERVTDASLLQTIYLHNDSESQGLLVRQNSFVMSNLKKPVDEFIDQAYLHVLSRHPSAVEIETCLSYFPSSGGGRISDQNERRDLVWALINTKEFIVNH